MQGGTLLQGPALEGKASAVPAVLRVIAAVVPGPRQAVVGLVALMASGVAHADDPPEPTIIEEIVVTGSRIRRPDFESASPIVTVSRENFDLTGAPTVEATLNQFPQFVPASTSTSNNPGRDGQATLSLRGLSTQSTLVLLDGRRLTPANGEGVADVNLIPPALIERVEIITGGASSVYGSDAVAGVVNFLLRQSFEGFEVGGAWQQTDRGDGEQWDLRLTAGTLFAGGRGSVYGSVGHSERRLVTEGDREFAQYPLQFVGEGNGTLGPGNAFVAGGSASIEEGVANLPVAGPNPISQEAFDALLESYGIEPGTVPFQRFFGFNDDGTLFTQGTGAPGSVANFRGTRDPVLFTDRFVLYNFAPVNALQLPLEHNSAFGRLQFDFTPATRLYAEGLYAEYDVTQQLAPTPVFDDIMPPDNPFVPEDLAFLLASRPDPDADFFWRKRLSEVGPRIARNEYRVHQGTLGVDGDVFTDWRYEAYVQQGETRQSNRQSGNVLRSRMQELSFAPDGGLAACGGFDIFGLGSIPEDCARFIAVEGSNEVRLRRSIAEASVEGPLLDLPAGRLRTAFGVFHKRDEFAYTADPIATAVLPDGRVDVQGFFATDDVDGEERNTDVYVEALVPLLADRPAAYALDLGLGYRHAQYDAAGGADAFKLELLYRPVESLRLRGSYQNAVRAPSIIELHAPQIPDFVFFGQSFVDPCEASSAARNGPDAAAVEALCLAQGVPPELLDNFQIAFPAALGFFGGNPDLEPEEANTWTLGTVWSPTQEHPRFGRLQVSIDWYRIEVKEAIFDIPFFLIIQHCFDPDVNPDFSPLQTWCTFISRDPATGEIVDAFQIPRNIAGFETSGIDLQLDWSRELGPGRFGANLLVSWLDGFDFSAGAGAPTEHWAGTGTGFLADTFPKWKGLLNLSYVWREFSLNARTRYIHELNDFFEPEFRIPSRTYLDLFADYNFGGRFDGMRLGLGVENVTDRDPPVLPSAGGANTNPQQYDVLGRRYFLRFSYRR
jgi:iron complex outermembrane recepter protein